MGYSSNIVEHPDFFLKGQEVAINFKLFYPNIIFPLISSANDFFYDQYHNARQGRGICSSCDYKKTDGVPYALGLSTVVAERFFDAITLIFIFGAMMQFINLDPDLNITFHQYQLNKETLEGVFSGLIKICFVFIIIIILISVPKIQNFITAMILQIPFMIPVLSIKKK